MATNAQTALTNRQYYAAHMDFGPPPEKFVHAPPEGKPAYQFPGIDLDPVQSASISDMLAKRDEAVTRGTTFNLSTKDVLGLSADALSILDDYENNYLNRPEVVQWTVKNEAQRISQWKCLNADIHDETEKATAAGTLISPSSTGSGTGSNSTGSGTPIAP